jgi:hypothetical protein
MELAVEVAVAAAVRTASEAGFAEEQGCCSRTLRPRIAPCLLLLCGSSNHKIREDECTLIERENGEVKTRDEVVVAVLNAVVA